MHLYLFCLHTLTPRVPPLRGGGRDPGGSTLTDLVIQLPFNILSLLVLHLLLLLLLVLLSVRILLRVFLFYLLCVCVFAAETYLYPMFAAEGIPSPPHTHTTPGALSQGVRKGVSSSLGDGRDVNTHSNPTPSSPYILFIRLCACNNKKKKA